MTRTTLDLDPVVLRQLKARQSEEGKTLGRLASELLARALADADAAPASALRWTAADLRPLVDLDDKEAVARALGDHERR
ncbi:MAG: hypothetical protein ACRDPK_16080 [Carbonactinosporaceae bacterium]